MPSLHRLPLRFFAGAIVSTCALSCGGSSPSGPAGPSPQGPPAAAAPTLSNVAPGLGATSGGQAVTISGTGFVSGAAVSIGGAAAANAAVASATSITAVTPPHAAGAVDVVVTNPDGQSARLAGAFNYQGPATPPPAVTSVGPSSGPVAGGTNVTIAGSGFAAGAAVHFGSSAAASASVASETSITATAPSGAAGRVDIVVTNPDGQSGRLVEAFTYTAPGAPAPPPPPAAAPPTLSGITPASGPTAGGTTVTLSGSGFVAGATVTFGGTAASSVTVASGTSITTTTPARTAGAADVVVTNPDGQNARLAGAFSYEAPAPPPSPVVVITITSAGVSPSTLTMAPGSRVRFVNSDTVPHEMTSDPHPSHTQCPAINQVGLLLAGQSRETAVFSTVQTCGYHDHRDADEPKWSGTIQIR